MRRSYLARLTRALSVNNSSRKDMKLVKVKKNNRLELHFKEYEDISDLKKCLEEISNEMPILVSENISGPGAEVIEFSVNGKNLSLVWSDYGFIYILSLVPQDFEQVDSMFSGYIC